MARCKLAELGKKKKKMNLPQCSDSNDIIPMPTKQWVDIFLNYIIHLGKLEGKLTIYFLNIKEKSIQKKATCIFFSIYNR